MDEKQTADSGHAPGCVFCQTVRPLLHNIWSEETRAHFRNSRVEFLKGIRKLLDDRIEHLSHTEEKGQRVTVE